MSQDSGSQAKLTSDADIRARAFGFCQSGQWAEALACFQEMLRANPHDAKILCDVGHAHSLLGQMNDAVAAYGDATLIAPQWPEPWKRLGEALLAENRAVEAAKAFDQVAQLTPEDVDAWIKKGIALSLLGTKAEAIQSFRHALAVDPLSITALYNLTGLKSFAADDPDMATLENVAAHLDAFGQNEQMVAHFTLGKAFMDVGDVPRAFHHVHAGNAAKRASLVYDVDADIARMDKIIQTVTPELLAGLKGGGVDSRQPIFVVGMPRSGSSLIEQILASHSMVAAAGEIAAIAEILRRINGPDGKPVAYPEVMTLLSAETMTTIGQLYLQLTGRLARGRARLTDKYLDNFLYAGVIVASLPNARIIHCRRDPVDTCLSCYTLLFGADQNFTYDMTELGRYWRAYDRLMAHWREILPADRFIDVQYEAVVADLEGQVRTLLDRLGLPFEAHCLDFHKTKRAVMTASASQVRQPIYQASVGRWKKYAAHIGPLLAALGLPQTPDMV